MRWWSNRFASAATISRRRRSSRWCRNSAPGLRNIDTAACAAKSVKLLTLRRRANISCAEHAFGADADAGAQARRARAASSRAERIKAAGRGLPAVRPAATRRAATIARVGGTRALNGATIGIIGLGEIGREIAIARQAFGMRVLYHQRTRAPESEERELKATPRAARHAARRKRLDHAAAADPALRRAT